jgi:glycosyltransferase involved in cell wall biosynthesis
MAAPTPLIAVVLPPREGFGPGRTGAVGMIAQRLAAAPGPFRTLMIGGPQKGETFAAPRFRAVAPGWLDWGNVNLRHAAAIARALRPLAPALIEVHNRPEIALSLASRLPQAKVALFLHNDPLTMRGARSPAERLAMLDRLARVVTVSDYLRRRLLQNIAAPEGRTPAVLPNCIDLAALPPPAAEREKLILFVGRVVPEKAPDVFVAACAAALPRLPGWRAAIIGADRFRDDSPDTGFVRTVRAAAEAAGVALLGYRDHPAVLDAMARAAMLVMPSRWQEPFGLTALEAMASGAALVASPRGGLPEVGGETALYADPDDPAAFTAAILALATNPAHLAAQAAAGRARARRFDLPPTAAMLHALRRDILAAGARRAGG